MYTQDVVAPAPLKRLPYPASRRMITPKPKPKPRPKPRPERKPKPARTPKIRTPRNMDRRKDIDTLEIVKLYTEAHLTVRAIGRLVGMSGAGVNKRLHRAGITSGQGERVERLCAYCGVKISRPRSRALSHPKVFCCANHYYADRANPNFHEWRQGSRLARALVAQHYPLSPVEIVHHLDGNQRHNDLANLAVYATQSDHIAVHHGRKIEPTWRGIDTQ